MKTSDVPGGKPTVALSAVALALIAIAIGLTVTGTDVNKPTKASAPTPAAHADLARAHSPAATPTTNRKAAKGHAGTTHVAPAARPPRRTGYQPYPAPAPGSGLTRGTSSGVGGMIGRWLPGVLPPNLTVTWGSSGGW